MKITTISNYNGETAYFTKKENIDIDRILKNLDEEHKSAIRKLNHMSHRHWAHRRLQAKKTAKLLWKTDKFDIGEISYLLKSKPSQIKSYIDEDYGLSEFYGLGENGPFVVIGLIFLILFILAILTKIFS